MPDIITPGSTGGVTKTIVDFLVKFGVDHKDAIDSITKVTKSLQGVAGALKSLVTVAIQYNVGLPVVIQGTKLFGSALIVLGNTLNSITLASIQVYQRTQVLGTILNTVGKNAGYTTGQVRSAQQAISALGITTQEASTAVIRLAQSEIDLSKGIQLARVAQDLAVISGQNSSEAYATLIDAISTFNPMLLRQFGLTKTLNSIQEEYAKKLGKTATSLSVVETRTAIINYILEEGKKAAGNYEAAMEDVGKKVTSLARLQEELNNVIGKQAISAYSLYVDIIYKVMNALDKQSESTKELIGKTVAWGGVGLNVVGIGLKVAASIAGIGLAIDSAIGVFTIFLPLIARGISSLVAWAESALVDSVAAKQLITTIRTLGVTFTELTAAINTDTGALNVNAAAQILVGKAMEKYNAQALIQKGIMTTLAGTWKFFISSLRTGLSVITLVGRALVGLVGTLGTLVSWAGLVVAAAGGVWYWAKKVEDQSIKYTKTLQREGAVMKEVNKIRKDYLNQLIEIGKLGEDSTKTLDKQIRYVRSLGLSTDDLKSSYNVLSVRLVDLTNRYNELISRMPKLIEEYERAKIAAEGVIDTESKAVSSKRLELVRTSAALQKELNRLGIDSIDIYKKQVSIQEKWITNLTKEVTQLKNMINEMEQASQQYEKLGKQITLVGKAYEFGRVSVERVYQAYKDLADQAGKLFTNNKIEAEAFIETQFKKAEAAKMVVEERIKAEESAVAHEIAMGRKSSDAMLKLYEDRLEKMQRAEEQFRKENEKIVHDYYDKQINQLDTYIKTLSSKLSSAKDNTKEIMKVEAEIANITKELEEAEKGKDEKRKIALNQELENKKVHLDKLRYEDKKYLKDTIDNNQKAVNELKFQRDELLKSTLYSEQQIMEVTRKREELVREEALKTLERRREFLNHELTMNRISLQEYNKRMNVIDEERLKHFKGNIDERDRIWREREQRALSEREERTKKFEVALNRYLEAAQLHHLDRRLLQVQDYTNKAVKIELNGINVITKAQQIKYFNIDAYFNRYAQLLEESYKKTDYFADKELQKRIDITKEMIKLDQARVNSYTVSMKGIAQADETILKATMALRWKYDQELFDLEMKQGKERMKLEIEESETKTLHLKQALAERQQVYRQETAEYEALVERQRKLSEELTAYQKKNLTDLEKKNKERLEEELRREQYKANVMKAHMGDYVKVYQDGMNAIRAQMKQTDDLKRQYDRLEMERTMKKLELQKSALEEIESIIFRATHTEREIQLKELMEKIVKWERELGDLADKDAKIRKAAYLEIQRIMKDTATEEEKAVDNMNSLKDSVSSLNTELKQTDKLMERAGSVLPENIKFISDMKTINDFFRLTTAMPETFAPVPLGEGTATVAEGWGIARQRSRGWGFTPTKAGFGFEPTPQTPGPAKDPLVELRDIEKEGNEFLKKIFEVLKETKNENRQTVKVGASPGDFFNTPSNIDTSPI